MHLKRYRRFLLGCVTPDSIHPPRNSQSTISLTQSSPTWPLPGLCTPESSPPGLSLQLASLWSSRPPFLPVRGRVSGGCPAPWVCLRLPLVPLTRCVYRLHFLEVDVPRGWVRFWVNVLLARKLGRWWVVFLWPALPAVPLLGMPRWVGRWFGRWVGGQPDLWWSSPGTLCGMVFSVVIA